jgi:hypothetical protein
LLQSAPATAPHALVMLVKPKAAGLAAIAVPMP